MISKDFPFKYYGWHGNESLPSNLNYGSVWFAVTTHNFKPQKKIYYANRTERKCTKTFNY